jgi:hypothetical protein
MLTVLQEKLAEAHGLAAAATAVTERVEQRVLDRSLLRTLWSLRQEAEELRARCLAAERAFGPEVAAEMVAHANSTHERAADLAGAWFRAGTGPIAAWSFLAMAEAAEVATWTALHELAAGANGTGLAELVAWALPIQERHLAVALDGAAALGRLAQPDEPRWG